LVAKAYNFDRYSVGWHGEIGWKRLMQARKWGLMVRAENLVRQFGLPE
jgi:hypothetical protein